MTEWDAYWSAYMDGYTAGTIGASSREAADWPEWLRPAHADGWFGGDEFRKGSDR